MTGPVKKTLILLAGVFLFAASNAHAATLFIQAANQDVYEGQTFVVNWVLNTEGTAINSIDLKLKFDPETLRARSTNIGNSLVSLWVKPPTIDNTAGTIELTGGIPGGVRGANLPIFSVTFEAVKTGQTNINVSSDSMILANDGKGTPVELKFAPILFAVQPKNLIPNEISSPSHPDQNKWYQSHDVVIKFNPKTGTDYSFSFSSNVDIIPSDKVAEPKSEFNYPDQPDGVYYFKVNSKVGPSKWVEAGVFRVQIDSTPPEEFTPVIGSDPTIFGGAKFLSFSTVDKTAGISHYMVKVGLFSFLKQATSPYQLNRPLIGDNITVQAIDNAGNIRTQTITFPGLISVLWFEILLSVLALIGLGWLLKTKKAR